MRNKRGWLRILEATIGILLISGVVLVMYSRNLQPDDLEDQMYDLQKEILWEVSQDTLLRTAVLQNNFDTVNEYVDRKIPRAFSYELKICNITDASGNLVACLMEANPTTDVYVEETTVASSLTSFSPKRVRLFVWERQVDEVEEQELVVPDEENEEVVEESNILSEGSEGLVSYWNFDNSFEDVRGSNDGIVSGGARIEDGVLYTDGVDDYVKMKKETLVGMDEFSFAVWVKYSGNQKEKYSTSYYGSIIGEGYLGAGVNGVGIFTSDNKLTLQARQSSIVKQATTSEVYNDGQWHFVVGTYKANDVNGLKLYVDGSLRATNSTASFNPSFSNSKTLFGLGSRADSNGVWGFDFIGEIDDAVLFDRALSLDDIEELQEITNRI